MSKLTYEDKKEMVRLHEEYGYGNAQLGSIYNVDPTLIHRLLKLYEAHGEEALKWELI